MPSSGVVPPARKSARKSASTRARNYAEVDSEEDDMEMEAWEKMAEETTNSRSGKKRTDQDPVADSEDEMRTQQMQSGNIPVTTIPTMMMQT